MVADGKKFLKYYWLSDFDRAMIQLVRNMNIMLAAPPYLLQVDDTVKTIVFERGNLIFVFNWHPDQSIPDYQIRVKETGTYHVVLTTDDRRFGGFGRVDTAIDYPAQALDDETVMMKYYNVNRTATVFQRKE